MKSVVKTNALKVGLLLFVFPQTNHKFHGFFTFFSRPVHASRPILRPKVAEKF